MFEVFPDVVPDWFSTFMNYFAVQTVSYSDPRDFVTSTTRLLDTGAEFAKFGDLQGTKNLAIWVAKYAYSTEFVDRKLDPVRLLSCSDSSL